MSSKNHRFSSSSSFSTSSSSSQLSTPRAFQNETFEPLAKYLHSDVEKMKCNFVSSKPKSKEELKEELVELETEIVKLEQYLLSLYRTCYRDDLLAMLPPDDSSRYIKTSTTKPHTTKFHKGRVSSMSETSVLPSFETLSDKDKIIRSEPVHPSLADLLGLNTISPNKLSEEIIRLICVIHFKLSDKEHSTYGDNIEACGDELGVVINKLYLDNEKLISVEDMLQKFISLVQKLEKVVPTSMAREEKLAFWINIHNALVMNAYIVYGLCEDTTSTMVLKATFNIGGEWVNAYDIQSSILGIRPQHSTSRLQRMFSPAMRSKTSSSGHTYALDYTEPLLHFALSTGESTDPMIRVYTAEGIFQELKQAREDFIQTRVRFEKTKILLPKIIYNYAKDTSLNLVELFDIISECLKNETQRAIMSKILKTKQERCIRWIKHDSNFRYIIHSELVTEILEL